MSFFPVCCAKCARCLVFVIRVARMSAPAIPVGRIVRRTESRPIVSAPELDPATAAVAAVSERVVDVDPHAPVPTDEILASSSSSGNGSDEAPRPAAHNNINAQATSFIDILDREDLPKALHGTGPGNFVDYLEDANRSFVNAYQNFRPTDPLSRDPLKSVQILESGWIACEMKTTLRRLLERGPDGASVVRPFSSESAWRPNASFVVTSMDMRNEDFSQLDIALALSSISPDRVLFALGCTSHERAASAYPESVAGGDSGAVVRSQELDVLIPNRRKFFVPATGTMATEQQVGDGLHRIYSLSAPQTVLDLFCIPEDLDYGVIQDGSKEHSIMPENHILADAIKHYASRGLIKDVHGYRMFALDTAPPHPINEPHYSTYWKLYENDLKAGETVPEQCRKKIAEPSNYLRVRQDVLEQAKELYIDRRQNDPRIETADKFGFVIGAMAEPYYDPDESRRWNKDKGELKEILDRLEPEIADAERVVRFEFRLRYAVKDPKPKLARGGFYFSIGIGQGVYPGTDRQLPIRDMTTVQTKINEFLTVPRHFLSDHLKITREERSKTRHQAALYKKMLDSDSIQVPIQ